MKTARHYVGRRPVGFTMVEVQLALTMLAIGLIGLLSVFPIGADWTRQVTEESVAQGVARIGMGVVSSRYGPGGANAGQMASLTGTQVQVLPGFSAIPVGERTYQFGAAKPFPAGNPSGSTYFWAALARRCPDQIGAGNSTRYDVYILVMKKGQPADKYNVPGGTMTELGTRDLGNGEYYVPAVVSDTYYRAAKTGGEYVAATRNTPQIGDYGIGVESGTVFRQYADGTRVFMNPQIKGTFAPGAAGSGTDSGVEAVIWVPPSDPMSRPPADSTPSPLVYVYQTTMSF